MTNEEIKSARLLLSKKHTKAIEEADTDFEIKMLEAEYKKNIKKLDDGINPFDKPENSNYECIGCGA